MDIADIAEIKDKLDEYFDSVPDPVNYPNSFQYYLQLYLYLKNWSSDLK